MHTNRFLFQSKASNKIYHVIPYSKITLHYIFPTMYVHMTKLKTQTNKRINKLVRLFNKHGLLIEIFYGCGLPKRI